jgi:hypothetical protein
MSLTAGQIAHQLHNNEVEIAQLKDNLANYRGDSRCGGWERRLVMVQNAQRYWQREYRALTGRDYPIITVPVRITAGPPAATDTGNPNEHVATPGSNHLNDPNYIDHVVAGYYDVGTGQFVVTHADGSTIVLNYEQVLRDIQSPPGGAADGGALLPPGFKLPEGYELADNTARTTGGVMAYRRDPESGKIYPSHFNATTAPNIVAMVKEVEKARGDAQLLLHLANELLLLPMVTPMAGGPARAAAWKSAPGYLRGALSRGKNGVTRLGRGLSGLGRKVAAWDRRMTWRARVWNPNSAYDTTDLLYTATGLYKDGGRNAVPEFLTEVARTQEGRKVLLNAHRVVSSQIGSVAKYDPDLFPMMQYLQQVTGVFARGGQ